MPSVVAYQNRLHVKATQAVEFTDAGSTLDATPPITNLGTAQLPTVVTWTGATATIEAQATDGASPASGESFSADVFAVLGIQDIDDGAEIEFFDADASPATSLGTVTWNPMQGQTHAVLVLSSPVTVTTVRVEVTSAGSGSHSIGALWAGPSVQDQAIRPGYTIETEDTGLVSRSAGGTDWSFGGETAITWPAQFRCRTSADFYAMVDALRICGTTEPVLWIPDTDSDMQGRFTVYGLVQSGWRSQHVELEVRDVLFSVRESR